MRTLRVVAAGGLIALAMAGCGGSKPVAGQSDAAAACKASTTNATTAASLASQAAAANSTYATLSADTAALAATQSSQTSALSDGDPSDDSGLGALAGAQSLGSGSDIKVIGDCVSLGLSVTH